MDEASDEVLMQRFCAGDEAAFNTLYGRYAGRVQRYLRRVTGSRAAAQDLTQATFVSLVHSRGRYRAGAPLKPWLYAIATNAARDLFRRRGHEVLVAEPAIDETVAPDVRDRGLEREVQQALAQLPEAQRTAIALHRFEGLSFAEIADVEGASETAVKVRAHRGYQRLRELLRGVWEGGQS